MTTPRTIEISVFGALRRLVPEGSLDCVTEPDATIRDLRASLARQLRERDPGFGDEVLLASSVFASDEAVLAEDCPLDGFSRLSILPPVCGG